MKRFLIISFVLLLGVVLIRLVAPGFIQSSMTHQLAKYDVELDCLEWSVAGVDQINIEQLCLNYKDIEINLQSVEVMLTQSAFWENNFDWRNLVPAIKVAELDIALPEKLQLDPQDRKTEKTSAINVPEYWLTDIYIQRLRIKSQENSFPTTELRFEATQQKQQRVVRLVNLASADNTVIELTQRGPKLDLNWTIDLRWLYGQMSSLLPLVMADTEQLTALEILSGTTQGKLELDARTPGIFQSQHQIESLNIQFTHNDFADPFVVTSDLQFQLNLKDSHIEFAIEKQGKTTLSGLTAISQGLLNQFQWQGIEVALPSDDTLNIVLPASGLIELDENDNEITALTLDDFAVNSASQQMLLWDIHWKADSRNISASFDFNNRLLLMKKDQANQTTKSNELSIHLLGKITGSPLAGSVLLEAFQVSGNVGDSQSVLAIPEDISWQESVLTGTSTAKWQQQRWRVDGSYQLQMNAVNSGPIKIGELRSEGKLAVSNEELKSSHLVTVVDQISAQVSTQGSFDALALNAEIPVTNLSSFNSLVEQVMPQLAVNDGTLSASFASVMQSGALQNTDINISVENAAATWQDYRIMGLNTTIPLTINSALEISAQPKQLQIAELHTGANITNLDSRFLLSGSLTAPQFQLQELSGDVFQGRFSLAKLHYPLSINSEAMLSIRQLQLNELVNLFGEQGIEVSGSISGDVPLSFSEGLVSVKHAMVKADGEGRLRIKDNAAFQNLKSSQETLGIALSLIEDLNYSVLQSDVQLEEDGWMTLAVNISGVNQKEAQPINFNPTLTTNLYTGLKALRAGQNITENIEQQLDSQN